MRAIPHLTLPQSPAAGDALTRAEQLQARLVATLHGLATQHGDPTAPHATHWARDGGRHGGGERFGFADTPTFNRASVNVSCVHYDDLPERKLSSATALSAIVHPAHPRAPSLHLHVSWTELRSGEAYWRVMADLNPSTPNAAHTHHFAAALRAAAPTQFDAAMAQGERYFWIPALGRHRGVAHFYLEAWRTEDPASDAALAQDVAEAAIDAYAALVGESLSDPTPPTAAEQAAQLAYHTLYLFQVLTLDRGTTSGLLVHDQNDVGILGSLPARIDAALLAEWRDVAPLAQRPLVDALLAALPPASPSTEIDEPTKLRLAAAVRTFYLAHPEALALQASGEIVPPTVENHR